MDQGVTPSVDPAHPTVNPSHPHGTLEPSNNVRDGVTNGAGPGMYNGHGEYGSRPPNKMYTEGSPFATMTPEHYEKLYLHPQSAAIGRLHTTFANPTPIALVGYVISLTPLSIALMGWRGSGGLGVANVGVYIFMGGLMMFIGGILEWIIGNTFSALVFTTFGGFWFAYATTFIPNFGAFSFYAVQGSPAITGVDTRGFNATFSFWLLFLGFVCLLFTILALRTNVVWVLIFFSLMIAFFLLCGARFALASDFTGNQGIANRCTVGAGASAFVSSIFTWYLIAAIMFANVDFPIQLPVFDLSTIIKGYSARHPDKVM